MKKIVVTGKTVEDALQSGLARLNVPKHRVKVHVLEQPSKGLFGLIGAKDAKIELELIPDPVEEAARFLKEVIEAMNVKAEIRQEQNEDGILFHLHGTGLGVLIGRRGQTLDSLQYLVNIVANRHSNTFVRIMLDAENFRSRRKQALENLCDRLAKRVIRTGKEVVLEPMSPQERKVIHTHLQNHPAVKTYSKGEEPNRRVVITLK